MRTIFPCWYNGIKSYTKGGQVQCDVCGSYKGVIAREYHKSHKLFRRCANCGSLEIMNNNTGKILKQTKEVKNV